MTHDKRIKTPSLDLAPRGTRQPIGFRHVKARMMRRSIGRGAVLLLAGMLALPAFGKTHRDPAVAREFQREHPCPSNGKATGACPGYVKDHIKPLCAGGRDDTSNMQW